MSFFTGDDGTGGGRGEEDVSSGGEFSSASFDFDKLFSQEGGEGARGTIPDFLLDSEDASREGDDVPTLKFGNLDFIAPGTVAPALGVYGGRDKNVDYLFADEFLDYRKKTWGQQMMYWAGTSWVLGGAFGGLQGVVEGLKQSSGKSMKLRINSLLNSVGKRGLLIANTAGVIALMLSSFESFSYHFITQDESPANYAIAGAATGLLFKSTKIRTPPGLKAAALWSTGLAALGLGVIYPSRQGYYGKDFQGVL
mmetsp:Transcript_33696/g.132604  ORF Transcript_33696/g.132604 Transcript_33696/m.132604 type:complete len:253 (-) Transcript_33696:128-886(-)